MISRYTRNTDVESGCVVHAELTVLVSVLETTSLIVRVWPEPVPDKTPNVNPLNWSMCATSDAETSDVLSAEDTCAWKIVVDAIPESQLSAAAEQVDVADSAKLLPV